MECSSGKVRLQFKSAIESSRIEYKKILKEINKLDTSLKQTNITQGYITSKIESNTDKLIDTKTMSEEIVSRDKLTAQELERQGQQLMNIHSSLAVVDSNLFKNRNESIDVDSRIDEINSRLGIYSDLKKIALLRPQKGESHGKE